MQIFDVVYLRFDIGRTSPVDLANPYISPPPRFSPYTRRRRQFNNHKRYESRTLIYYRYILLKRALINRLLVVKAFWPSD